MPLVLDPHGEWSRSGRAEEWLRSTGVQVTHRARRRHSGRVIVGEVPLVVTAIEDKITVR